MKKLTEMSLEELWQLFPIVLKEHNPAYASWYAEEKGALLGSLKKENLCRINHIGSTAVEGLLAKPIVDILLELPASYDLNGVAATLQQSGWIVMAEDRTTQTLDLNKGYTPAGFAEKVYHLHIKPLGDWDELYFRDFLQAHPEAAAQYAALKHDLQQQFAQNRDGYTRAKTGFIRDITQKARKEFAGRYLPEGLGRAEIEI